MQVTVLLYCLFFIFIFTRWRYNSTINLLASSHNRENQIVIITVKNKSFTDRRWSAAGVTTLHRPADNIQCCSSHLTHFTVKEVGTTHTE